MAELHHRKYPYPAECVYLVTGAQPHSGQMSMDTISAKVIVGRSVEAVKKEWAELHDDKPGMQPFFAVPLIQYQQFACAIAESESKPASRTNIPAANPRHEADKSTWLLLTSQKAAGSDHKPTTQVVFANSVGDIEKWAVHQGLTLNMILSKAALMETMTEMAAAQNGTARAEYYARENADWKELFDVSKIDAKEVCELSDEEEDVLAAMRG